MFRTLLAVGLSTALLCGCAAAPRSSQPVARAAAQPAGTAHTVSLRSGFSPDPYELDVTAGGNFLASARSASCTGYIADTPDLVLNFTAGTQGYELYIFVYSDADTTLVVRTPSGAWYCNDDDYIGDTLGWGLFIGLGW